MAYRKSTPILNGRAKLYPPRSDGDRWQVVYADPVTGKQRNRRATTREAAEAKASEALGDWTEEAGRASITPPTVAEAFESWMDANRSRWVDRTADNYRYRFNGLRALHDLPVTAVRPADLREVSASLSREQAKRLRTVVRGIFDTVERWTGRDGRLYAEAVRLPGTRNDDAPRSVEKSQIPRTEWVVGAINCLYATCQPHPALSRLTEQIHPITGEHTDTAADRLASDPWFMSEAIRLGAPLDVISSMRRGMPQHYKMREQRRRDETIELASRFRQIALLTALGAAGALRIGEALALRPRHLFGLQLDQNTVRTITMAMRNVLGREIVDGYELHGTEEPGGWLLPGYRGRVEVVEQVSPLSSGRMNVTPPKMHKERTVWLSPLLYPPWDSSHRTLRELLNDDTAPGAEAFEFALFNPADRDTSLWRMTESDALQLWRAGYVPVTYLLHDRLRELWVECRGDIRRWWDCLLFPTRNRARNRGDGPKFPERWPHGKEVPNGTFQNPSNLSYRYISPVYDYVSTVLHSWPGHKGNTKRHNTDKEPRKGWTHHALRHWAISQWLGRGTPVSMATSQAGHKDESFTLSRYSSALKEHLPERGFEP